MIKHEIMRKGVLIRHLVMPGLHEDSMMALDWIKANLPTAIVNIMAQYRPSYRTREYKEIDRRLTTSEYRLVSDYFTKLNLRDSNKI